MRKILVAVLSLFVFYGFSVSVGSVFAYDVQPGDNALLTKIYDRIDQKMITNVDDLVAIHDLMPLLILQYGHSEKNTYFLSKIDEYLVERLYRATSAPTFSCIAERVQGGDSVTIDYHLTTDQGKKISLTKGQYTLQETTPLLFNPGKGQLISGVERATYGMQDGATKGVTISYHDAYGSFDDGLVVELPRQAVEHASVDGVFVDQVVTMNIVLDGATYRKTGYITALTSESVTVNFNHVLAGHDLSGLITVSSLFKKCQ